MIHQQTRKRGVVFTAQFVEGITEMGHKQRERELVVRWLNYLARVDVRKNGTPTTMAETELNDGGSKENKLRPCRSNHHYSLFFFLRLRLNNNKG